MTATMLPKNVFRLAGSNIRPGRNRRANHGTNAPSSNAPANWKRLRIRSEVSAARTWSCRIALNPSQCPPVDHRIELPLAPHTLEVGKRSAWSHQRSELLVRQRAILV